MKPSSKIASITFLFIILLMILYYFYHISNSEIRNRGGLMKIDKTTMTAKDPRDGQTYRVVIIGRQVWLCDNLRYRSGLDETCFENNPDNCDQYGLLYQWETAQSVAPLGWRIPSKLDWDILMKNLGKTEAESFSKMIKGGASGFDATLNGYLRAGSYFDFGLGTAYWSATEFDDKHAWACFVYSSLKASGLINYRKDCGFYVRLIKDEKVHN